MLLVLREDDPPATERAGYISLNGVDHYHTLTGRGDTLVVLHGGPGLSHRYLRHQLDALLSTDYTLLYYDQRGSGWSGGVADTAQLTIGRFLEDLERLRQHFQLHELHLLGHSFGGLLGMYYGITYPARLQSLVLVDTDAASYALRTPYQTEMIDHRLTAAQSALLDSLENTAAFRNYDVPTWTPYYKTFLTTYFADPADTLYLSLGFDTVSIPKIDITNQRVRSDLGDYDIHDRLKKFLPLRSSFTAPKASSLRKGPWPSTNASRARGSTCSMTAATSSISRRRKISAPRNRLLRESLIPTCLAYEIHPETPRAADGHVRLHEPPLRCFRFGLSAYGCGNDGAPRLQYGRIRSHI